MPRRAVVAALALLPLAACSGGDGDAAPAARAAPTGLFAVRGEAVCRDLTVELQALLDGADPAAPPDPAVGRQTIGLLREAVADLRVLEPPAADAEPVGRALNSWEAYIDQLEAGIGVPGTTPISDVVLGDARQAGRALRDAGLPTCAGFLPG